MIKRSEVQKQRLLVNSWMLKFRQKVYLMYILVVVLTTSSTYIKKIVPWGCHTSKIIVLRSSLNSEEMLQNFLYLYKKKTQAVFFILSNFPFYLMNALIYVDIDQGIHKVKRKVARNEKRKKLLGFSFCINVAKFEAFLWN